MALLGLMLAVPAGAAAKVDFNREVQPIFAEHCYKCHGPDAKARKGNLRLDVRDGALRKNDPVLMPGAADKSELVQRICSEGPDRVMPPAKTKRRLSPQQIDVIRRWVNEGAVWGRHWAFEPPQRHPLPDVRDRSWPRNGIDHFILARLEREGLRPSPEAPREVLLRRVSLDLTGLPPTPEEVDLFLKDDSPATYERAVDRLLASPRYGEHMAWDWLDAARYADTNGFQADPLRTMWPWRDWVVRAFNANMPFDQFTIEQLAGDLLPGTATSQKVATGFNRNHMYNGEGGRIAEETRVENVMDRVETTATVWLGLTFTCARCHNHKFDPFTQREYYQLFAFFNNTSETGGGFGSGQVPPVLPLPTDEQQRQLHGLVEQLARLQQQMGAREKELLPGQVEWEHHAVAEKGLPANITAALKITADKRTPAQALEVRDAFLQRDARWADLRRQRDEAQKAKDEGEKSVPRVMIMDDLPKPRETFILVRGTYNKPAEKVTAGTPATLPPLPPGPVNRLTLARWLMSPNHPLTARVAVNRAWQTFFGTGLVKTTEDFGIQGEKPSHPDLLDWLARELDQSGWDIKALHRLLVTSATYRQSSRTTPEVLERDPENRLLAHGPRYRLPAYVLRDQALAVAGLLVEHQGGPSVKPYQPPGVWEEATFGFQRYQQDKGADLYRRSLYTFWKRIVAPTMFFDVATRQTCTVRLARTNTPLHALLLLNDVTYVEAARNLAQRLLTTSGPPGPRLDLAFRLATARKPTDAEAALLFRRLEQLRTHYSANPAEARKLLQMGESSRAPAIDEVEHAAWTGLSLLLLNLDETLTQH
jgi:mono/diheme cytochrome c family protein